MYVSVTRVNTEGLSNEVLAIVAEEVHRWLRDIDGFEGFAMLSREGSAISLSFFESREVADRHSVARSQVRERVTELAGAEIEEVLEYEVTFAALGPMKVDPGV